MINTEKYSSYLCFEQFASGLASKNYRGYFES